MSFRDLGSSIKEVFGKPRYVIIAFLIAIVFYSLNVLISSYGSLISFYNSAGLLKTIKLFITFFIGFSHQYVEPQGFISLLIISVLLGILFSMIIYRTKMLRTTSGKSFGFFGTVGIFLGILVPGCAACGIGLLSALGLGTAALTFLPFDGIELSILAILILGYSTFKISKDIKKEIVCEI